MQSQNITMIGEGRQLILENILNENQIEYILKRAIGENVPWILKESEVRRAMDGIAGFIGDHMKATLHVDVKGENKAVYLFLKSMPVYNKPKAEFINQHNFFRRERLMYTVLDEISKSGPSPWCSNAYIYTDSIIVMPELTVEGYTQRNYLQTLDLEHILVTTTSVAQFHAAFINYETKKSINLKRPYATPEEFSNILEDTTFCDSPWLRAGSKLSANLLKAFSTKAYRNLPALESDITLLFIEACDNLREYKDTVNILLHRDLWVNNIMFKYENDVPVNAVLVDYQCIRYGPPAYDLMMLLYLTTDRKFREERERDIFDYYYSIFVNNLNADSKMRLECLGYDKSVFLKWCEKSRMFGMCLTMNIFPFILMDPKNAEKTFDDPKTYVRLLYGDRTEPVLAYANSCEGYKQRNLSVTEEFVERYILKQI